MFSRAFCALFIFCILCSLTAIASVSGAEDTENGSISIGQNFVGEELKYDIGFWIFHGVAEGRLVLKEVGPGRYVSTLSAKTNGVVDTLLKHRRDKYVAKFRLSRDGKRFLTESFEKEVTMDGKGTRRSVHRVDYVARTVTSRSWGGGKPEKISVDKIPDGMYTDDPLAAFYNFRFGVYGDIVEGKDYRIMTFPKEDRIPEIFIHIAPEKEFKRRNWKGIPADLLADAKIDKDLFGSSSGDIEIFFTSEMLPVQAIAKGILLFGDVKGKLSEVVVGGVLKKASNPPPVSSSVPSNP
jgi:hypothetical protein